MSLFHRMTPIGDRSRDDEETGGGQELPPPYTATVSVAVYPPSTLPVTVASSSADPSLNTLSLASVTCDRFLMLSAKSVARV